MLEDILSFYPFKNLMRQSLDTYLGRKATEMGVDNMKIEVDSSKTTMLSLQKFVRKQLNKECGKWIDLYFFILLQKLHDEQVASSQ